MHTEKQEEYLFVIKEEEKQILICMCKSPQWKGAKWAIEYVCFNTSALLVVPNQFKLGTMEVQLHCLYVLPCLEHGVIIVLNQAL